MTSFNLLVDETFSFMKCRWKILSSGRWKIFINFDRRIKSSPLGPEKRPKRPVSGHQWEKPTWWLRSHQNFGHSTPEGWEDITTYLQTYPPSYLPTYLSPLETPDNRQEPGDFYFSHTTSDPTDLWPLRHLLRVMRRHDMTKKIDKDKDKDNDKYRDKNNDKDI